jgi:hypothetical protein
MTEAIDIAADLGDEEEKRKRTEDMNDMNMVKRYDFDRLPRESAKAFAAFQTYLDLGPERSLAAAGAKLGKSKVMMEKWSRRHDWQGRVAAYGGYVAEVERQALAEVTRDKEAEKKARRDKIQEQEWEIHDQCIEAGQEGLRRFLENDGRRATLADIARLLELASKLGRLATGLEGEGRGEGRGSKDEAPEVRVEVTLALEKIYGEPLPGEVVDVEEVGEPEKRRIGEPEKGGQPV